MFLINSIKNKVRALNCLLLLVFFTSPGEQGRPVYLPSRDKDGGRKVSGLDQLDVELGRRC